MSQFVSTAQQDRRLRIAIAGRYLDEVRIQLGRRVAPGSVSYRSFPVHRHRVRIEEAHVIVSTPATTAVQLFADGALAPIGGPAVAVSMGVEELGPCHLEAVETGDAGVDDAIVLRFRRASEATP